MTNYKSFLVTGETKFINGLPVRDLSQKVDTTINDFSKLVDEIVDIKINTQITGVQGDYAYILILYKGDIKTPTPVVVKQEVKQEVKKEEVEVKDVKKRSRGF